MARKETKADLFWQAEDARWLSLYSPSGALLARQAKGPPPGAKLMILDGQRVEPCHVDSAIAEALEIGLLERSTSEIRNELALLAIDARAGTAAFYAAEIAAKNAHNRIKVAKKLAKMLGDFLVPLAEEADIAAEYDEKAGGEAQNFLQEMVAHTEAIIPLLERYAEPEGRHPPATDHIAREFFTELGKWWKKNAIEPERRRAKAIRNRLGFGLWLDMEYPIPDGYSDTDFAQRLFKQYG